MSDNVIPLFKAVEPKKKITARQMQRLELLVLSTLQSDGEGDVYDQLAHYFKYQDYNLLRWILSRVQVSDDGIYYIRTK